MEDTPTYLLLLFFGYHSVITRGFACPPGESEVFLLTMDVNPNVNSYHVTAEEGFTACADGCSRQTRCKGVSIRKTAADTLFRCQYLERSPNPDALIPKKRTRHQDIGMSYLEKTCLRDSKKCDGRLWAFERISSRNLTIPKLSQETIAAFTKEQCLIACLDHQDFACLSVGYNSRLNECYLSPYNRFSTHNPLLHAGKIIPDVDYFESNCVQEPRGFCNFRTVQGTSLADEVKNVLVKSELDCQNICFQEDNFVCRSFSFNQKTLECSLSHSGSHGLLRNDNTHSSTAYQITSCYQVSVSCEPNIMMIAIQTNTIFDGKVYSQDAPDSCHLDVNLTTNFKFPVSLTGPECNTVSETEGKFSNVIVIQNNDLVLTSIDKAIGIHCSYQIGNKTEFATITIKNLTSKEIARGRASPPHISLRILDMKGNDRASVKLGEPLRVQVIANDETPYGIFVRNMVATDASRTTNLTLIDSRGCPAETQMVRAMRRIDGHQRSLESIIEAFTFTGSNILRIETDVETCLEDCNPVTCNMPMGRSDDEYMVVESFGKRRRRDSPSIQVIKLSKSIDVKDENFGVGQKHNHDSYALLNTDSPNLEGYSENTESTPSEEENCVKPSVLIAIGCSFVAAQLLLLAAFLGLRLWRNRKQLAMKNAPKRTFKSIGSSASSQVTKESLRFPNDLP